MRISDHFFLVITEPPHSNASENKNTNVTATANERIPDKNHKSTNDSIPEANAAADGSQVAQKTTTTMCEMVPMKTLEEKFQLSVLNAAKEETAIVNRLMEQAKIVAQRKVKLDEEQTVDVGTSNPKPNAKKISRKSPSVSSTTSPSSSPDRRKGPRIRAETLKEPNLQISNQECEIAFRVNNKYW